MKQLPFTEHLLWEHNMLSALGRMSYPQNKLTRNWLLPHFTEEETKSQDNYGACQVHATGRWWTYVWWRQVIWTWISLTPSLCLFQVHHDVNLKLQVAPMFTPIIYNGQDMEIILSVHQYNEYYSAIKRGEMLSSVTTWMNVLSEINQRQKTNTTWSHLYIKNLKKKKTPTKFRKTDQICGYWGRGKDKRNWMRWSKGIHFLDN